MSALGPQELAAILDGVSDGVIAFDASWRFTYLNANAARIIGQTREDLLGTLLWEVMPELRESPFGVAYQAALADQAPRTVEAYYPPLGAWFESRVLPSRGGVMLFFRDVTERHRFQESLLESERRFRLMAEAVPQILWISSGEGEVEFFNAPWYRLTGATPETSLGSGWLAYVHPDDQRAFGEVWSRANAEARGYEFECRYRRVDGAYRWFLARAYPELDAQDRPLRWYGASTDITELREAAEQIQLSEQRYRTFVSQSTEGIWRVEAIPPVDVSLPVEAQVDAMLQRGVMAECNDAMARMYGFEKAAELEGTPLSALMPTDDPKNRAYLAAFVESGFRLENAESRELDREGRSHIFQNSLVGLVEGGRLIRAWGTQRDITAQVEAREEAARLTAELQEAVRIRDDFLSIASHELKTPLTPLGLRLEALAKELQRHPDLPFSQSLERYVDTGRRQVRKLTELVNDLLDVSRISAGRFSLSWEPVELTQLVREVATRFEPEAARAGSTLTVFADGALEGEWDRLRLEQVAENLISNAVKYGGGTPIEVRLRPDGGHAVLTVSDRGIGIDAEAQRRIFERFERAVSARHYGGLGLGLYITRTIVNLLGGEIRVESEPGRGTLFEVRLPFQRLTSPT